MNKITTKKEVIKWNVKPNRQPKNYYESLSFGMFICNSREEAIKSCIKNIKARTYKVQKLLCEDIGNSYVIIKNVLEEEIVKHKEVV